MGTEFRGFGRGMLELLIELSQNNDRAWFEANRARYESQVREPALAFVRAMKPRLREISMHFVADDRKMGGSLMRVHRDTRFSRDKTPYKTNVGIQFRHELGRDVHAPGLYVHVALDECFLGMGCWRPEPESLAKIRERIEQEPKRWLAVVRDPKLSAVWEQGGESLVRAPRGVSAQHPALEDLKRKDFILASTLSVEDVVSPRLPDVCVERFVAGRGHLRFLCAALDVPV